MAAGTVAGGACAADGCGSSRIGSQRTPTCVPSGTFFMPPAPTGSMTLLATDAIGIELGLSRPNARPWPASEGVTGACAADEPLVVPVAPARTWTELRPRDTSER